MAFVQINRKGYSIKINDLFLSTILLPCSRNNKILALKIFEICTSIVVLRIFIWNFSWTKVKWYLSTHLNAIQIKTLVLNQSITHVIILYFLLRIIAPYRQNKRCVVKLTSGNHVWSISTKCVSIKTISFRLIITHVTKYWKI